MAKNPPNLLNEDGSASMATALMMSHHGLRRDLALFRQALQRLAPSDEASAAALQEEWTSYHATLHGHHEAEDQHLFPHLRSDQPSLAPVIERLTSDHRRIDPLLAQGDRAFSLLPATRAAAALVAELSALLDPHLATEEAEVVPFLRAAKDFPPSESEEELKLYAEGFAWSCQGIAPDVLEQLHAILPQALATRLPAARAAFEARFRRVWGDAGTGASRTAVPDWLAGG